MGSEATLHFSLASEPYSHVPLVEHTPRFSVALIRRPDKIVVVEHSNRLADYSLPAR